MKALTKILAAALIGLCSLTSANAQKTIYDITVKDMDGNDVSLSVYKGKVLLIVNTATACGFTPQYEDLEAMYRKFKDKGLVILDFPCNQFGAQAPGSIGEIDKFCTSKYETSFPRFDKVDVNGDDASPLFTFLKGKQGFKGFGSGAQSKFMDEMMKKQDPDYASKPDIKWNFTKFLINKKGQVVERFEPTAKIEKIAEQIENLLR